MKYYRSGCFDTDTQTKSCTQGNFSDIGENIMMNINQLLMLLFHLSQY